MAALVFLATLGVTTPRATWATVSLGAWVQHSPDDISGFTTLSGNDATASATMPFSVTIEGVSYSTVVISTNGWLEFGGNTQGTSHPANACLPTATHTNPFLAAYWDDLNPFGTNIRYGTVGTSPSRTFIVDYQVDVDPAVESGGADDISFQVQVHEGSNLINVRYRGSGNLANGQSATIGFQGAGGAGGTAQPITCNGKVLDDNRPNEGWSADASRAGNVILFAHMAHSPDDISGFTTLTGDEAIAGVTLPFSVTVEGTSYSTLTISTNGYIQLGTTTGANAFTNTALPSSSFSGPTLFYYWDDLQTEGGNIRYGTVGTSPNRTFIVDFQENLFASTGDKVNGQVQIHETSGLMNVKYRSTLSANANGQSATIGFQGAGGASAATYPLTFNGKILDDNRPDEGWSVHPRFRAMSLHSVVEFSPDDISGFTTLTGDEAIAGVTLPFSVTVDGTSYSTLTISTNGYIQLGTTSGTNAFTNTALPNSSFPGPTLFYYWDDLQTEGGNIRYGTVGTSPNRTFIVDFQENLFASSGDKVNGQVQIHEGSNEINVQYRSTISANANGQSATIGFQGAGGASAVAYPLTFNGKILDDNLPDAGWSVAPLPICGNSAIETGEQCDLGGANGASATCCTSSCLFRAAGQTCRTTVGICDVVETCTGASANCPADGFVSSATTCRPTAGVCDVAENCTGSGAACPADGFQSSSTVCRGSAGICDVAENCTGSGAACPANGFQSSSTVCRGSAGVCDVAENCTGSGAACPADGFQSSSTVCRGSAGVCDVAENCTGSGAACPANGFQSSSTVCRGSAGVCDVAENCTGSGAACPANGFQSSSTVCRGSAGVCDVAENCTGSGAACPANGFQSSSTVCRGSAGVCDVAENCTGSSAACPADAFVSSSTVCRGSAGVCDLAENCTGSSAACPADAKSTAVCRASAGICDVAESCDGVDDDCPADAFASSSTVCRSAGGVCDLAENCTGSGAACPADSKSTAVCRASGGVCDLTETCDGVNNACPADAKSTAVCRASAGVCDVVESCDGVNNACPADGFESSSTVCRASAGVCDLTENCTGSGVACPADAKSTAVCRPSAGVCDLTETCDGANDACPADSVSGAFVVCRPSAGVCDLTENCDGSNVACPADAKSTAVCRASAGICDVAESCDGVNDACPANAFESSATVCRAAAGICDLAENCTGSSAACPADAKSTAVCRPSAGVCDVSESCDGAGDDCPTDGYQSSSTACRPTADVCDVAENCTGAGVACPADGYQSSSTVCRPTAGVCDLAENCTGAGVACPADAFKPSSTVCRADAGQCDLAENCTGSSAPCPPDAFEPDGTACDDGNLCTDPDTCTTGSCTSGGNANLTCAPCEACDPGTGNCGPGPRTDCIEPSIPGKARVLIKDKTPDKGDLFVWKFVKGEATTLADFGDPTTISNYTLCVFDDGAEVFRASIPADGTCGTLPCWRMLSSGYKYIDRDRTPDGILKTLLKAGAAGKAKIIVKGKGDNLPFPPSFLPMATPVKVQLQNDVPGTCWQTIHISMGPLINTIDQYKAVAEGPTP